MKKGASTQEREEARSGFTLIEWLVVIGMMVIMAGLPLPVLASAKQKAQSVVS